MNKMEVPSRVFEIYTFISSSLNSNLRYFFLLFSQAYSVYDSEIGYCQGQSFLIAALLLQMPEEQTFGVLVKVMHDLGKKIVFSLKYLLMKTIFVKTEKNTRWIHSFLNQAQI